MEIKEILENNLKVLYESFQATPILEATCALNKEIRETARLIIEIENAELEIENVKNMLQILTAKEKEN